MSNPITCLTKKEWAVWIGALLVIVVSNVFSANFNALTLVASCVGVTSLIIAAKGNVWSQILMILFSILYGIISWQFHYWGEMMTYLGMTMPMAIWSTITWIQNPSESGKEVEIQQLTKKHVFLLVSSTTVITILFFKILAVLETPNIVFSTISITTSIWFQQLEKKRNSDVENVNEREQAIFSWQAIVSRRDKIACSLFVNIPLSHKRMKTYKRMKNIQKKL